jgi:hypothetical protein
MPLSNTQLRNKYVDHLPLGQTQLNEVRRRPKLHVSSSHASSARTFCWRPGRTAAPLRVATAPIHLREGNLLAFLHRDAPSHTRKPASPAPDAVAPRPFTYVAGRRPTQAAPTEPRRRPRTGRAAAPCHWVKIASPEHDSSVSATSNASAPPTAGDPGNSAKRRKSSRPVDAAPVVLRTQGRRPGHHRWLRGRGLSLRPKR